MASDGRVKWGILSTAEINTLFLAGARQARNMEVVAVASRDGAGAERFAREMGIERAYAGYEAVLQDPDVEAVYIPLPNALHAEWTVRALEAGKHVLCEKPLSRVAGEVEHAFDVAEREGRLLMEAYMYRHNPQTRRMTELVQEGAIGRLRVIRGALTFSTHEDDVVRLSKALHGGALMDMGCYCVSAARVLAGEPDRVSGEQLLGGDGVDVAFAGLMRFPGDVIAYFDAGLVLPVRRQLELVGEEGVLLVSDPWRCEETGIELRTADGTAEWIAIDRVDSYGLEAENFSAAIRGEAEPLLGRADAVGQARAIEALYASAEAGRAVTLS